MTKEESVQLMTDKMAKFVAYVGKKLPDDVEAKLAELREKETSKLATTIYDTMFKNQKLAVELDRPCCQDTGFFDFRLLAISWASSKDFGSTIMTFIRRAKSLDGLLAISEISITLS